MQRTEVFIKGADGIYYIAPDKFAPNGVRKYTIAKDGFIIPMQINAHALDSPDIEGVSADHICVGIDTISNLLSYWGGGVEKGETLQAAMLNEGAEECGEGRDVRIIHKRIITFASLNDKWQRENDDMPTEEPEVGLPFKLRTVLRVASRTLPVQQEPLERNVYPEFLRPRYEPTSNLLVGHRLIRKSCQYALQKSLALGNLMIETSGPAVQPDMEMLALEWQKMHIHPAIIDYYCGGYGNIPSLREKYKALYGDIIAPVMLNMEYQEQGLTQLLRHPLPNDAEIRQHWQDGREDAAHHGNL